MMKRLLRHFYAAYWGAPRCLPAPVLKRMAEAVAVAERGHLAEICLVVEASLTPLQLMRGLHARERALEVFAQSRIWDTAHNSGVLVYVLLGDHAVEIVSDRGLAAIEAAEWATLVATFKAAFASLSAGTGTDPVAGCVQAISTLGELLRRHLPAAGHNPDELPDPVRLL